MPPGVEHPDTVAALELCEAAGLHLDPWQRERFRNALLRRDDKWAAFEVGGCAPRQNGKNVLLEARELAGLFVFGERLLIHSAHLADTAKEAFRRLEEHLEANEWLSREVKHIWRTNGHEAIELKSGQRIRFRTRTTGGGRGFSANWIGFDEAMILPVESLGAIMPVVSAQRDPQLWYMGSAVDQTIHEHGLVFSRLRSRGTRGDDPSLYWFEWSVDATNPEEVTGEQAADPESWAVANPALGIRISLEHVGNEHRSMPSRTFAVERLGVGDWMDPDGTATVINLEQWATLEDRESEIAGYPFFAFDVNPERTWATIAAAGYRTDGKLHVEVVDRQPGTGWVAARLMELAKHNPSGISCDGVGPAASLIHELDPSLGVEPVKTAEHAQACGYLVDEVVRGTVRHLAQPELTQAVRGAGQRPLADSWAWSRKNSLVDISPLVACTLALWGATQNTGGGVVY